MPSPENGEMIFSPQGGVGKRITEPKELAEEGIHIATNVIEETWGPHAVEEYRQALQKPKGF